MGTMPRSCVPRFCCTPLPLCACLVWLSFEGKNGTHESAASLLLLLLCCCMQSKQARAFLSSTIRELSRVARRSLETLAPPPSFFRLKKSNQSNPRASRALSLFSPSLFSPSCWSTHADLCASSGMLDEQPMVAIRHSPPAPPLPSSAPCLPRRQHGVHGTPAKQMFPPSDARCLPS